MSNSNIFHFQKSVFLILMVILLSIGFNLPVYAMAIPNPSGPRQIAQLDFISLNQALIVTLDKSLNLLAATETKVAGNPYLSEATKQTIYSSLNNVEYALLQYKNEVENATSLADLRTLNQEITQYLKDNKDVIKENMKTAIIEIGNQALQKAEELKQKVEAALKILKVTCPKQKQVITELENQLAQLESQITALNNAIKTKDTVGIKTQIKQITQLSQSIVNNLTIIENQCF